MPLGMELTASELTRSDFNSFHNRSMSGADYLIDGMLFASV